MGKSTLAIIGIATLALAGCSSGEKAAESNLQNTAMAASDQLENVASEVPNSAQANAIVNQEVALTNADLAVENKQKK